jgi:hypothetical protein
MRAIEVETLRQAKRLVAGRKDVRGVDFGILYRNGRRRGRRLGIRFHVAHKRVPANLAEGDLLPSEINGVPCDVVVGSYEPHNNFRLRATDPPCPGISIGNVSRQATGTLGCYALDEVTRERCIVSNWHVLCGSPVAQVGDMISQPGPRHLGLNPARPVGKLHRWLDLNHGLDAGIALLDVGMEHESRPLELQRGFGGVIEPVVGMRVIKSGAITGITHGLVDGTEGSYPMDYSPFGDTERWMDGFRIVPDPEHMTDEISLGGDSGSLWIDKSTWSAVGLHFGGEDGLGPLAEYAIAHALPLVFSRLQVVPEES